MGIENSYTKTPSIISTSATNTSLKKIPSLFTSSSVYKDKNFCNSSKDSKSKKNLFHRKNNSTLTSLTSLSIEDSYKKIFHLDYPNFLKKSKSEDLTIDSKESNDESSDYEFKYFNNADELRDSYYKKLISKGILTTQKESSHNTLFIFDWDDTFFFTTYLSPNSTIKSNIKSSSKDNSKLFSLKDQKKIESIEYYLKLIITKSLSKGQVFIITNSSQGWVEHTAKHYYPQLSPLLSLVNIISARALYEKVYPDQKEMWKLKAFEDIQKKFRLDKNKLTNIISIGDNENELQASKLLARKFNNSFLKTIKFREEPDLVELIKQLKLIEQQLIRIYAYTKNLNIRVEKMKKNQIYYKNNIK